MLKTIAIANQKGGVGQSTTSVNLAASLNATRQRVLLIDLDPQGNATMGSGVDKNNVEHSIYDVLVNGDDIETVAIKSETVGYSIIPSNTDTTGAEVHLLNMENREYRLDQAMKKIADKFDYVLIDCPPSLNMLTINALVAAKAVMIPMQCEYYALEGLSALMETIQKIKQTHNPDLEIEGLLRTMYDPRTNLSTQVTAQLDEYFGDKVYRTIIPRNVRLAEAPSHGVPVLLYDKASRGAQAYLALAGEMLRRNESKMLRRNESEKEAVPA